MNIKWIILLNALILGLSVNIMAQQKDSILFLGKVMEHDSLAPLPDTHIIKNHQKAQLSDERGKFTFYATPGDTITFSFVGFHKYEFVVSDTLKKRDYIMGVFLHPDTVALTEILVFPRYINLRTMVETNPVKVEREKAIAHKNVQESVQQGLTQPNLNWDAETNTKYELDKQSRSVQYRGQVSPDQIAGVHVTGSAPIIGKHTKPAIKEQMRYEPLTAEEEFYIKTIFTETRKKK